MCLQGPGGGGEWNPRGKRVHLPRLPRRRDDAFLGEVIMVDGEQTTKANPSGPMFRRRKQPGPTFSSGGWRPRRGPGRTGIGRDTGVSGQTPDDHAVTAWE